MLMAVAFVWQSFVLAQNPPSSNSFKDRVAGLTRKGGFFPYYWDDKKGEVLFELSPGTLNREFLYFTALGTGVGSTEVFADRSSFGSSKLCRLRRVANRVLVIEENTSFRATQGSTDLKHSIEESFPVSVLAVLPVEAELDGTVLINANPFRIDISYRPAFFDTDHHPAIQGDIFLQPGSHNRGLGYQQRHRLALHVGAHQSPVGVVVFQERNQARRYAHHLLG